MAAEDWEVLPIRNGARPWWPRVRYWLYVGHRWAGIVGCLLFVIWFFSGIVMTIVPWPEHDEQARRNALAPLDWNRAHLSPRQVLLFPYVTEYPRELRLEMLLDEPVYRMQLWNGDRYTLSAVDGHEIRGVSPDEAERVAHKYANANVHLLNVTDRDQWTVTASYDRWRPLFKFAADDGRGSEIYVSSRSGEVVLATTRSQRAWNWLGSIPHWIYFTPLRANQPLWRQVNLWVSGPCMFIAASGIWIGILRLRVRKRYRGDAMSPYRGWKLWHHWAGIIGGLTLMTWILSGWLSVNPNGWLDGGGLSGRAARAYRGHDDASFPVEISSLASLTAKKAHGAEFVYRAGVPYVALDGNEGTLMIDPVSTQAAPLADGQIFEAARRLMPDHSIRQAERLTTEDSYWYSHHVRVPMPVLRVEFDDAEHTAVYLEPGTGTLFAAFDDGARRNRWWFDALHRLDFGWLFQRLWLWYGLVWVLAALGLVSSLTGVVIGWRRLRGHR